MLGEERHDRQKNQDYTNNTTLNSLVGDHLGTDQSLILRAKNTGAWLNIHVTTVSVTVFSDTEFCDFLCAHNNVVPLNLQIHCNRCGADFDVCHALICSKVGLVISCHKEVFDELFYLARQAFTPASVRSKLLIHQVRTISEREIRQGSDKNKNIRGYMMIRSLWDQQADAIIDIKLGDADTYS